MNTWRYKEGKIEGMWRSVAGVPGIYRGEKIVPDLEGDILFAALRDFDFNL